MKRFIIIVAIFLMFAGNAFATASSVTWSSKTAQYYSNSFVEITADVICDSTNGSFVTTPLYMNEADEAAGRIADVAGYYLHSISVYFGGTAPTINSDIEVLEHSSTGKDILVGAGADMMDAATNNYFTTLVGTLPYPVPVFGPLYLKITNNSVNSATSTIVFKFVRR
jgi:hypothetical protein